MMLNSLDISRKYIVTGAAGFIGYFLSKKLLEKGYKVIGIDNLNDYYDVNLKYTRLKLLEPFDNFIFIQGDISDKDFIWKIFNEYRPMTVVNLAAQAGVRYSIINPDAYIQSNIIGFFNVLEACRAYPVEHLIYASSSSVYGANKKIPFEESDFVDHPVSLYAATKKTNELMAHTYSHLYHIPITGLRFFTVYGPLGRPDMAYFSFTKQYFNRELIRIYNNGDLEHDILRDFTYIDDIVEGVERIIKQPPKGSPQHIIYNIGNNRPEKLMYFISTLEKSIGKAIGKEVIFDKKFEPMVPGDVPTTYASTRKLEEAIDYKPSTPIEVGLQQFANWYTDYYKVLAVVDH